MVLLYQFMHGEVDRQCFIVLLLTYLRLCRTWPAHVSVLVNRSKSMTSYKSSSDHDSVKVTAPALSAWESQTEVIAYASVPLPVSLLRMPVIFDNTTKNEV
jgi:hypothetical protein